jgi:hypothetical protein
MLAVTAVELLSTLGTTDRFDGNSAAIEGRNLPLWQEQLTAARTWPPGGGERPPSATYLLAFLRNQ